MSFLKRPATHIVLIVLVGGLVYSNTFHVPFVFDDTYSISDNPLVKSIGNFIARPDGYAAYPNRYIGYLTFALNYRLCGLDVRCYHIVNLAIHLTNALLVYLLIILTFRTDRLKGSSIAGSAGHVALFASLLVAAHPLETQAVTYIVQRLASLATMFYLAALVFFIMARFALERKKAGKGATALYYMLSLLSAVLAMKTKETAFTLPLIAVLYEFFFFEGRIGKRFLSLSPMLFTLLIIPISIIVANKPTGSLLSDISKAASASSLPRGEYLLTQFNVVATYFRLLLLPVNQNLDYDYPISHSLFEPRTLGSLILLLCVFGVAVLMFVRSRKRGDGALSLVSFGILWFFITLSVESSVIPIEDVIFEHRVYLPSIGIFIALSCLGAMASRKYFAATKLPMVVAAVVVLSLSVAAYGRNSVWASEISLWEDNVKKSPGKARPRDSLGVAYYKEGLVDKAIEEYRLTLRTDLVYVLAHEHLGAAYYSKGWFDRAIDEYKLALQLCPDDGEAHYGLGDAYYGKGSVDEAIDEYNLALKVSPDYKGAKAAHNNLGMAYSAKGLLDKAAEEYRLAAKLNRDY